MQLHELRTHPVIRWMAYFGFALIIISFVFFYGWQGNQRGDGNQVLPFAEYESSHWLSFLPWRKWESISSAEVQLARQFALDRKIGLLGPGLAQLVNQQGVNVETLVTTDEAVQEAVDQRLLNEAAARIDLVVSEDEAEAFIRQFFTPETLDLTLAREGISLDEYRGRLMRRQLALRMQNLIVGEARASLYELWLEYLLVNERITLNIASYGIGDYLDEIELSDEEMEAYLEENAEKFALPARRSYRYVKLTRDDLREALEPTADDLQVFYEQNQADFLRPEAVRLQDVFAPVNSDQPTTAAEAVLGFFSDALTMSGADWREVVNRVRDEHEEARLYFREIGWVGRDDASLSIYGKQYLDRGFALTDDQISTSVLSPTGMHVVQRLEYREAGAEPLEDVRDEVERRYRNEKAEEDFGEAIQSWRDERARRDSRGEVFYSSVRDFARGLGLEDSATTMVQVTVNFIPEIGSLIRDATYLRGLKLRQMSGIFQYPSFLCVLEIEREEEAHPASLEDVREEIEAELRRRRARDRAHELADAAWSELRTGLVFEAAIGDAPSTPTLTAAFTRGQTIASLGFPLIGFDQNSTRLSEGATGFSPYGFSKEEPDGYAVWKVEKIESPTREEFADDRRRFESEYLAVKGLTVFEEWLGDQRRNFGFRMLNQPTPLPGGEDEDAPPENSSDPPSADTGG